MPIFDHGYRAWESPHLRGRAFRWLTIAHTGIRLTGRGKWLRRFVMLAWLPLLYYALAFFVVGRVTDIQPEQLAAGPAALQDMWQVGLLSGFIGPELTEKFISDPASFRPLIWSLLLHMFLRYTQVFCVMIVVAIVGPRLVSEDLRTKALSVYFSKPLTRLDYVLGKLAVVAFWVGSVTLAPTLALYVLSIAFSPGTETLTQTIGVLPKLIGFCGLIMLGTGAPMLALSSLARNPRFLGFIWAGTWVMSMVVGSILHQALFRARWVPDENPQQVFMVHQGATLARLDPDTLEVKPLSPEEQAELVEFDPEWGTNVIPQPFAKLARIDAAQGTILARAPAGDLVGVLPDDDRLIGISTYDHIASYDPETQAVVSPDYSDHGFDFFVNHGNGHYEYPEGDWTALVSANGNFNAVSYGLFGLDELLGDIAEQSEGRAERLYQEVRFQHDWSHSLLLILGASALSLVVIAWRIGRPEEGGR